MNCRIFHGVSELQASEFEKRIKFFPSTLRRRNSKTQQSEIVIEGGQGNDMIIVTPDAIVF